MAVSCLVYFFNTCNQILTKCWGTALFGIFETFDLIGSVSMQSFTSLGCYPCQVSVVSEVQLSSLVWADHVNTTHSKIPRIFCEQFFWLLGLGKSQEVSECGHVISAIDLNCLL